MKLPHAELAVVEIVKLRDYCLNANHLRGRHEARVFAAAVGLTTGHAEELRDALLDAAHTLDAAATDADEFGQRYVLDFTMKRPAGTATVRSCWIVRSGYDFPRLTSGRRRKLCRMTAARVGPFQVD